MPHYQQSEIEVVNVWCITLLILKSVMLYTTHLSHYFDVAWYSSDYIFF
jgi:hypothetical protein